nr:MAG TPA: hypothetical protein [Caudoviricetes sp.]
MYFFHSNQRKRDWSWMHQNPVNKQLESRNLFYFIHKSKASYWWRDYSRLYACK